MEDKNERLLAPRALQTTRDNPWPLALLLEKMDEYIDRMVPAWVEAQVIEYNQRPGNRMSFFRTKNLEVDMPMQVKVFGSVIAAAGPAMQAGARIVMQVKPDFYTKTGDLSLMAAEIHPAGMGGMLEGLERLKQRLAAEGLSSREHKKELPFLPRRVGLICGHRARAQADVKENVWRKWPLMEFKVREITIQGENCPREIAAAVAELDTVADTDVIVVIRGGGALEDLLGFSDGGVVRAAFAAQIPIVSAVGHEEDTPLLDFVVGFRASTPTDAVKHIVPDCVTESELMKWGRQKIRQAVETRVSAGLEWLQAMRSRPVMQNPGVALGQRRGDIAHGVEIIRARIAEILAVFRQDLAADWATLTAISPRATLERDYAVLRTPGRALITDVTTVRKGDLLEAVLVRGSLVASVVGTNPGAGTAQWLFYESN